MATDYPKGLLEFEHWFRTEGACREYLLRIRWPDGFCCPQCGHRQAWKRSRSLLLCGKCKVDIRVTAGTIFHGSHLPLRAWFRAMWWITNQKGGVNAVGLQRLLGLGSYKTAWTCLHKLRRAMVRAGREQLLGRVEVDETVVGGERRGAHGWHADAKKALVVVAAEVRGEGIGRVRLRHVPDTKFASLNKFVQEEIAPGSEIITDGHKGYLEISGLGYKHSPTPLYKNREVTSMVLGRAHRVASLLKRWLLGMHQGRVSREQLEHYLEEFTFRFNRRRSVDRGMLFYRLVQQSVATGPNPYQSLIKRSKQRLVARKG